MARQKIAGILCVFQEFLTQYGKKDPLLGVLSFFKQGLKIGSNICHVLRLPPFAASAAKRLKSNDIIPVFNTGIISTAEGEKYGGI